MTEKDANLPEEVLHRIARKKQEALEAEIQALEEMIASDLDRHIAGHRAAVEEMAEASKKESEEAAVNELKELQSFGENTLRTLDAELKRRRSERLNEQARRHDERVKREKREEEARRRQADEEAKKKALEDPVVRIRTIIRHAQSHMQRGDMELAQKVIAEGLELDGFNAELIDLDAKVREAMASETFTTSASPAKDAKKEKGKDKPAKAKEPKARPPKAAPAEAAPAEAPRRKVPAWVFTIIAAVLVLAVALIVYLEYTPKTVDSGTTLAVLPWTLSGDAGGMKVFSDALPEVVVRTLATTQTDVSLLGYTTSSNLASFGPDPVTSLIRLGYSHFLRGALTRRDSTYMLHVELTDSGGTIIWSQDYQRDAAGMMIIPREIAHGIRSFLGEGAEIPGGTAMQVYNAEAYLLYLEGLNALREPDGRGIDSAIGLFNGALGLYSKSSDAYAALSTALEAKYAASQSGTGNLLDAADSAASTAMTLDPRSSSGYLAMSRVLIDRHRYEDALEMLDSAARFSPGETSIPYLRGLAFFRSGQPEQALELLERAYRLDPRNAGILDLMATIYQMNRAFDKALWYRETAKFFSGDSLRYVAGPLSDVIVLDPMIVLNQSPRVASACLKLLERDPQEYPVLYSLARILQVSGDIEESVTYFNGLESLLRAQVRSNPNDTHARMYLGLTLTRLGRYADGLAVGEAAAAADTGDVWAKYLLARIYALQMYSPQTKTVDSTREAKALDLLTRAVGSRFIEAQLCSADLYNVYYQSDIRSVFGRGAAVKQ